MPSTISEVGPCRKLVKVTVEQAKVKDRLDKNYRDISSTISLPGFRRGKVPRNVIEKRFGKHVEQELTETLVKESLGEALDEAKLQPIGQPKLEKVAFDAAKDPALEFEASVSVRPEFEMPKLDGIRVEKGDTTVKDEDVARSLEASQRARGELRPKADDATVAADDFMIADVDVLVGGASVKKIEGGHFWVKNDKLGEIDVEKLAEKLGETKIGGKATFPVKLADSFSVEEARGKDATLEVSIKELKEVKLPALDDAFAKDAGFESLQEFKDEVRQRLLRQKDAEAEETVEEKAVEEALELVTFELPGDIIDQELDELALRARMQAKYKGATDEEADAEAGKTRQTSRDEVVTRLKGVFLLDRIARDQKIFATEDEIQAAVQEMAMRYGRPAAEVEAELDRQGGIQRLRFDLRMEKARKWLRSKVEVVETGNR